MDPLQLYTRSMENLISILVNNPDAPILIVLLVWIITQVNKIKARVDAMQHDIDHLLRAIVITKLAKDKSTNNRHKDTSNQGGIGQEKPSRT